MRHQDTIFEHLRRADAAPGRAETLARLRLSRTEGIGPATFRRLIARHGTAD